MRIRDCARNCNSRAGEARIPAAVKLCIGLGDKPGRKRKIQFIMKKAFLLLLCGALAFSACDKNNPEGGVKESDLTGEPVDLSEFGYTGPRKIFILNEGQKGANNASLDVIRFSDKQYLSGVFKKVNPGAGGLGDVGNDIAVIGDEVWIVVNNSGIVEVISAEDEKEIAAIQVPTPRRIAYDDDYVYVTSWAGAFVDGSYDESYNFVVTDSANPKGQVYRIDRKTKKVKGSVEVGYQPEGIGLLEGKLYVANSGGISCQIAPDYAYDHTISVIDAASFTVSETIDVVDVEGGTRRVVNLKDVYVEHFNKKIYFTALGDYGDNHSGLYYIQNDGNIYLASHYVSVSARYVNEIYCIGTEQEFDWDATSKEWSVWSWSGNHKVTYFNSFLKDMAVPYGLFLYNDRILFVSDAGDYFNPGTVTMIANGEKVWTVTAGVCPGHFAIW